MQQILRTLIGAATAAALGLVMTVGAAQQARAQAGSQPAPQKKLKDQGESDIYNEVVKDMGANNFAKAITDLDTWKSKYPESDFKDDRVVMYIQAYSKGNQPAKALDTAADLIARDPNTVFTDPKTGPGQVVTLLFMTSAAITQLPNPTPEQFATAEKAAHQLIDYNRKPDGVSDADWANARNQLQATAKAALMYITVLPGEQAMKKQPPDCPAAESAYTKALQDHPENAYVAYQLARAMRCQEKEKPEKTAQAIYEYQRAAVIDPTLGGSNKDPKKITSYADNAYITIHGSNEGLEQLKEQVKQAPLPPAGFKIKTATEIAQEKEAEFEKTNPQLALWMKIKGQLADTNGQQYFDGQLKDAAVPQLKGTLVDAKPACRPKELLVAVPLPDAQGAPRPEITLKLDAPLTGKPELNNELQWEGVPKAFSREPFMLTMDTEKAKTSGLKVSPCTPAGGGRRPAAKPRQG